MKAYLILVLTFFSLTIQAQTKLPADRVIEDVNHRFVADTDKANWNALTGTKLNVTAYNSYTAAQLITINEIIASIATKLTQSQADALYKPIGYTPTYAALPDKPTIPPATTITNNLTTTTTGTALDAAQGKVLNDAIATKQNALTGVSGTFGSSNTVPRIVFQNGVAISVTDVSVTTTTGTSGTATVSTDFYNVKDAGIVGDGVTDQTTSFSVIFANQPRIFIPAGQWLISNDVKVPSDRIIVLDQNAVIFRMNASLSGAKPLFFTNSDYVNGNKNITIIGGKFDGNSPNQTRADNSTAVSGVGFRFNNVTNLTIMNTTIRNPVTFGIQVGNITNLLVEDITLDYTNVLPNTDGVHLNGGVTNFRISRIKGDTNDDLVALNADDQNQYQMTTGPIRAGIVEQIYSKSGYRAMRINSDTSPITDIEVREISGSFSQDVILIARLNSGPSTIDRLTIKGIKAVSSNVSGSIIDINTNVNRLILEDVQVTPRTNTSNYGAIVNFTGGAFSLTALTVSNVQIRDSTTAGFGIFNGDFTSTGTLQASNINYRNIGPSTTGANLFSLRSGASINNLEVGRIKGTSANTIFNGVSGSCVIGNVIFSDVESVSTTTGIVSLGSAGTSLKNLTLNNIIYDTPNAISGVYLSTGSSVSVVQANNIVATYTGASATAGNLITAMGATTVGDIGISNVVSNKLERTLSVSGSAVVGTAMVSNVNMNVAKLPVEVSTGTVTNLAIQGLRAISASSVGFSINNSSCSYLSLSNIHIGSTANILYLNGLGATLRITTAGISWGTLTGVPMVTPATGTYSLNGMDLPVDKSKLTPLLYDKVMGSNATVGPYWWNGTAFVAM